MSDTRTDVDSPSETDLSLHDDVSVAIQRLKKDADGMIQAARLLGLLANKSTYCDPKKLAKVWEKLDDAVGEAARDDLGLTDVSRRVVDYIASAPDRLRRQLGRELRAACLERGLELRTVCREAPVEVRIPPLSLVIDFAGGKGDLCFARDSIERTRLDAESILEAYDRAMELLDKAPPPEEFFDLCRAAYLRVLRLDDVADGDRVELGRLLPELALLQQSKRFCQNPKLGNYQPYSCAQFAHSVLGLRRARLLERNGLRINFGVATGISASQKGRTIYIEDEQGNGEHKLTIFFASTSQESR